MTESHSPLDANEDELKQALAAFGEDALELLLDEGKLVDEFSDFNQTESDNSQPQINPVTASADLDVPLIGEFGIEADDSSLIRYTKELANAIYCGQSMPLQNSPGRTATGRDRCIVFTVSQQPFALPLHVVREIVRRPAVTVLPRTPAWLRGVTNVRGQIVSVIDLGYLLGLADDGCPVSTDKAILVHNENTNQSTNIVVERILGIRSQIDQHCDLSSLTPELQSIANSVALFDAGEVVLIDSNKLFELADMTAFSNPQINT